MKFKLIIIVFCTISFSMYMLSCSKMNDLHEEFMQSGETIYAARLDSISALPGKNRAEIGMVALSQRVDRVRIYWNDDKDSVDVQINNQTGTFNQVISGLSEGEYIFHLTCFDKYGNSSLSDEISCYVYGDQYASGLQNRGIDKIDKVDEDIIVTWRSFLNAIGTKLIYEDTAGGTDSVFVPATEKTTTITNAKYRAHFSYESYYVPVENAIDTFKTSTVEGTFPAYILCDKSLFTEMHLLNDMNRLGWDDNERMLRLWDGSVGPQGYPWVFHSNWDYQLPATITFDMGKVYDNLAFIEETGRDCCGNPIVFEVWGIDDISEAETTIPANDPAWPDEALNKGWTLLKEVVRTDDGKQPYKIALNEGIPSVRYIRLRFKELADGGNAVNLSEVTFWYAE